MYVFVDVLINVLCIPLVIKRSSKSQSFCDKLATATVVAKQSLLGLLVSLASSDAISASRPSNQSPSRFTSVAIVLHISRHRAALTPEPPSQSRGPCFIVARRRSSRLTPRRVTLSESIFVTLKYV